MSRVIRTSLPTAFAALALLSNAASAQNFVNTPAQIPATGSSTENVDFGDIDLDGDMDVSVSDGGDAGNDQPRIYVNMGFAQAGTIGFFTDDTAARMPVLSSDGRDIEFGDFDNDGDLDIYTSNTAQLSNQSNHWLINSGGKQLGAAGFYFDDTPNRWVNLGGAGSSVAPSQVLGSGGFIDWSCDCDFADLDNDGDIDLHHSTYGGSFVGNVPHRVFLNNGDGFFAEFNPSGFQLGGTTIANGNPGIWCEGTYQSGTTSTSGAQNDIAGSPLGIEIADIDGDLDIDMLFGSRNEQPRMFKNRMEENGGTLSFRDVSGAPGGAGSAYSAASSGSDNYENELGDMDNDGDVDAYMLNYQGLTDNIFNNPGNGQMGSMQALTSSGNDDNEGDFSDYDSDGDLDLTVAAFASTNRLYRNNYAGGGPGTFTYTFIAAATSGFTSSRSLDSDNCDVDQDGDYDNMTAEDSGQNERLYINTSTANDTFAPYFGAGSAVANQTAAAGSTALRRQVYDNAPYYITWYNDTRLELKVDSCPLPSIVAQSSQGQIFRALLPKNLVGNVAVNWRSTDDYGNSATTAVQNYTGSTTATYQAHYGVGTAGSLGVPVIDAVSVPFPGSSVYITIKNVPAGQQYALLVGGKQDPPLVLPGLFTLNLGGVIFRVLGGQADANGCGASVVTIPGSAVPGSTVYFQMVGVGGGTGGFLHSASDGLEITVQ